MATTQVFTTITIDEAAPGLKTIFSFVVPDQRSGKVLIEMMLLILTLILILILEFGYRWNFNTCTNMQESVQASV